MSYTSGLKTLRAKLLEQSTGTAAPESNGLESFISSREPAGLPQDTTEDLISRGANWISEIKKASLEFKKAYDIVKETAPVGSPLTSFVEGIKSVKEKEAADERKAAFVERRSESSPSTYAPKRPGEEGGGERKSLPKGSEGPTAGYGGISQKQIESVIRSEATARKMDPDVAVAIFYSEGAGNYQSQVPRSGKGAYNNKEDSWGPYQLYRGGGLGNAYEKATGRDLREDNTIDGITNQVRFALDAAVDDGWAPWYGRKTAGVGVRDGLSGATKLGNWQ